MSGKQTGQTLIELCVTLGILAVIVGAGAPAMTEIMASHRLRVAANALVADFQFARNHALRHHARTVICPSGPAGCEQSIDWTAGWTIFVDHDSDRAWDPGEPVLRNRRWDARDIQMETTIGRKTIRFRPHGDARGSNATIRLCSTRADVARRAVIVSNSGRARVERRTASRCS